MNNILDLSLSEHYDIIVEKNRSLNYQLQAEIYSGDTNIGTFDFSTFTGATLEVRLRPNDFNTVLKFSTEDGSIVLGSDGLFTLIKTSAQMYVRASEYHYDMYISSDTLNKRGFLKGKFIIEDSVTR